MMQGFPVTRRAALSAESIWEPVDVSVLDSELRLVRSRVRESSSSSLWWSICDVRSGPSHAGLVVAMVTKIFHLCDLDDACSTVRRLCVVCRRCFQFCVELAPSPTYKNKRKHSCIILKGKTLFPEGKLSFSTQINLHFAFSETKLMKQVIK